MNPFRLFTLADIPVYISPFFLLLLGYYALRSGFTAETGIFVVVVSVSLLIHELGHGLVARHYRLSPRVLLHGFGGACIHERPRRDLHDVLIISAGPGLGLLAATVVSAFGLGLSLLAPQVLESRPLLSTLFLNVFFVGVVWNLVNLLPLWPLDGGQLFRLGMVRLLGPARGGQVTHAVGVGLGVLAALLAWRWLGSPLMIIIAALLTWQNLQHLRSGQASGAARRPETLAEELYAQARQAMHAGDWREAARLGHQIRAEGNVPADLRDQVWEVLALAAARQGNAGEALRHAARAPDSPLTTEARLLALATLHQHREARELLASPSGLRLPAPVRAELAARLSAPSA